MIIRLINDEMKKQKRLNPHKDSAFSVISVKKHFPLFAFLKALD